MKDIVAKQHYVTFYSPGTFVSEQTVRSIDEWSVHDAVIMADGVTERYGATPYGFQFTTRGRRADDLDSKELVRSPFYYLGGTVETLAQVKARAKLEDRILVSNMEGNGWDRVITNTNSWKITLPLNTDDVVLDYAPPAQKAK